MNQITNIEDPEAHVDTSYEWLVTNGLGGYASGTVGGLLTRRYHGLLIAALPSPLGRTMMLNGVSETLHLKGHAAVIAGTSELMGKEVTDTVTEVDFTLDAGLPVWHYRFADCLIEKCVVMTHDKNETCISYKIASGSGPLKIQLRPGINFRSHDAPVETTSSIHSVKSSAHSGLELAADGFPTLYVKCEKNDGSSANFVEGPLSISDVLYRTEQSRGYESHGCLWSPGYFEADIQVGESLALIASAEEPIAIGPCDAWSLEQRRRTELLKQVPVCLRSYPASQLVLAADQFLIAADTGDERQSYSEHLSTVIAGYHWFTAWGRDTMISLEGLTLVTGRFQQARAILEHFAHYVQDGLIPNMFPEGKSAGLYNTADATLWFFHAISRYLAYTGDNQILEVLLPKLRTILDAHIKGTRFNIHVDPSDQLLVQGEEGVQLTWMDAKVSDWVVTPRRGKAVEINALWYNALMNTAGWLDSSSADEAAALRHRAGEVKVSFNRRFWQEERGYLLDVVDGPDGDDASLRPNQLFSMSLPFQVLDREHWPRVLDVVTSRLVTPLGLRTLDPADPKYCAKYFGNLWSRDAAYHQGTVWAWLIGPFIDAWINVHPERSQEARKFLEAFAPHLQEAGVGSISEIFDAEVPHVPRGCIAQAWSVAEVLRCWQRTA